MFYSFQAAGISNVMGLDDFLFCFQARLPLTGPALLMSLNVGTASAFLCNMSVMIMMTVEIRQMSWAVVRNINQQSPLTYTHVYTYYKPAIAFASSLLGYLINYYIIIIRLILTQISIFSFCFRPW